MNGCIIGGDGLGKRGVESFAVGSSAAKKIADILSVGACVDSYVQVNNVYIISFLRSENFEIHSHHILGSIDNLYGYS